MQMQIFIDYIKHTYNVHVLHMNIFLYVLHVAYLNELSSAKLIQC